MKLVALIGLLALLGYVSAECGCLKCSKHLTVIGKARSMGQCPPTTVICRGSTSSCGGKSLPIRVQTPGAEAPAPAPNPLRFKIVATAPCGVRKEIPETVGSIYDTRVEIPVVVSAPAPSFSLKPCIDRIVIPAPPEGCGPGMGNYGSGIEEDRYVLRNCGADSSVYLNPDDNCKATSGILVNPSSEQFVYLKPGQSTTVYEDTSVPCGAYASEGPDSYKAVEIRQASGPALDWFTTKRVITRYTKQIERNSYSYQIGSNNAESKTAPKRSKREVPFLKHGYKFVMNMLPEFIQEPIKNTVNVLALTHPDERLRRVYNIPRKLTLKEKLKMKMDKKKALLKSKFMHRVNKNNLIQEPYPEDASMEREARNFLSSTYHPTTPNSLKTNYWQQGLTSRSNFLDNNLRPYHKNSYQPYFDTVREEDSSEDTYPYYNSYYPRNPKKYSPDHFLDTPNLIKLEKAVLLKKLKRLNEAPRKNKRSAAYERYWSHKLNSKPLKSRKPVGLGAHELILPFFQVKQEGSPNRNHYIQRGNPWDEHVRSRPPIDPEKYRYRRDDDIYNFLEPYTLQHAANENYDMRERFLRSIVREELMKQQQQSQKEVVQTQEFPDSYNIDDNLPHSPILNIISLPAKLIKKFNDLTTRAFPVVGSVPQVITGTKRYFRDFGKNLKKNVLHLTSDLIGDFEHLDLANGLFTNLVPTRKRRNIQIAPKKLNHLEPDYTVVFKDENSDLDEAIRRKRYILQMVDEDEIEHFLMDKLGDVFGNSEDRATVRLPTTTITNPYYAPKPSIFDREEEQEAKLVLEQLKPKIIVDGNGRPFLEINGYKRPLLKKPNVKRRKKLKLDNVGNFRYYDSSEEVDSERISSLIDHAKDHLENNLEAKYSEMPINTIKEKISQLLLETDVLVHMDFRKYDEIYDDLIALQLTKTSIVQDWKRLVITKSIDDINAKIALLEKFKELQYYKDLTLSNIVSSLSDENENIFITKKLIKMLLRLQKLQCIINQVMSNFHDHLHISSKSDTETEIEYVDYLSGLNFANKKSRNDMVASLIKDRDTALQKNIILLDKLRNLLMYDLEGDKIEREANLLWEMKNIEKMQRDTIEEMMYRLNAGYKIKKELRILFDLLRKYEGCEADQKRLLSKSAESGEMEEDGEIVEESSEEVEASKPKKFALPEKLNLEELKAKLQERIKKRKMLLRKKLKRSRKFGRISESDENE